MSEQQAHTHTNTKSTDTSLTGVVYTLKHTHTINLLNVAIDFFSNQLSLYLIIDFILSNNQQLAEIAQIKYLQEVYKKHDEISFVC